MTIEIHHFDDIKIAEINSDETIIRTTEDGLDLLGNLYYQGFDSIVLYEKNITPAFFDLKSGLAGDSAKFTIQKQKNDFKFLSQSTKNITFFTYDELVTGLEKYIEVLEKYSLKKK